MDQGEHAGDWNATIEGTLKIHGVERPISLPVQVARSPSETRVRGAIAFKFGDYGMTVPADRLILSVVDDVRLEIDVVAREDQPGASAETSTVIA